MDGMALKSDLQELKSSFSQEMKVTVAQAVDPLKAELHDLKAELKDTTKRIQAIESKQSAAATSNAVGKDMADMQKLLHNLDPSNKQVAFTGWPASMSAVDRVKKIDEFIAQFPGHRCSAIGHFFSGPYSDRKLSGASYAEFGSPEDAREALKVMKDKVMKANGATIQLKPARSKLNGKRNFSIRKAEELVKAHHQAADQEVKIEWKTASAGIRHVTLNSEIAFIQDKPDVGGTFSAPFDDLSLP